MSDGPQMRRPREIILDFADGKYPFRLTNLMIAEVQTKCGAGIGLVYRRVTSGIYELEDLIETIRHGLIGAGLDGVRAGELISRYGGEMGGDALHRIALAILHTFMHGYVSEDGDDTVKKTTAPKDGLTSPVPTEPDT